MAQNPIQVQAHQDRAISILTLHHAQPERSSYDRHDYPDLDFGTAYSEWSRARLARVEEAVAELSKITNIDDPALDDTSGFPDNAQLRSMYQQALSLTRKSRRDRQPSRGSAGTRDAKAGACFLRPASKFAWHAPQTRPPPSRKRGRTTYEDSWYESPWWESEPTSWWESESWQTASSHSWQVGSEPTWSVQGEPGDDDAISVASSSAWTQSTWTVGGIEQADDDASVSEWFGSQFDRSSARSVQSSRSSRYFGPPKPKWWDPRHTKK